MIFITGDCHGEFQKFSTENFPSQRTMNKTDIMIVCGDFGGIWNVGQESAEEKYWLDWLENKPFTTVFVDGNHENFDRLYHDYETVMFHGGKAHKIRNSVYHLMRGEIFDFEGLKFLAFGGAGSHDVKDGILYKEDFATEEQFRTTVRKMNKQGKQFRINKLSWWAEELPSAEEFDNAEKNLSAVNNKVDYVITHCTAQSVIACLDLCYDTPPDRLSLYFDDLRHRLQFTHWFFGHYHDDKTIREKFTVLYDKIIPISSDRGCSRQ